MTGLVTVAHGTRRPDGNEVAVRITEAAASRLGVPGVASYVELSEPLFADVLAAPRRETTVAVPLLLSTGFHVRTDLPAAVSAASGPVLLGPSLGPDALIASAQVARLLEAGAAPGQSVVMVAAGSRDPAATDDLARARDLLARAWGGSVRLATLAGIGRRPADVVEPGDAVSPYLLAEGFFASRCRREAVRADVVAPVIGPHPLLVDLVVARATSLLSAARSVA